MARIILTQQVPGLGGPGDVVEVKDGYARNYLLPRKLAMKATRGSEKEIATIRRAREVREIRDLGEAQTVAGRLAALDVQLPVRAGQGGRLFGSVTSADVAAAIKSAGGPNVDRRRIELAGPIKTAGTHTVTVALHPEVSATVSVHVVPQS